MAFHDPASVHQGRHAFVSRFRDDAHGPRLESPVAGEKGKVPQHREIPFRICVNVLHRVLSVLVRCQRKLID
jgi:hypothetical protein